MAGNKNLFKNLSKMDTSYLLDPSVAETVEEVEIAAEQQETTTLSVDKLVAFQNHPFRVNTETEKFQELLDSVSEFGVLQPIIVRPSLVKADFYEIISGHCRAEAAKLAGLEHIPVKIIIIDDFMATVIMTHTNIYGRDEILISEKAKAYRMCMDEEEKLGKNRTDIAAQIGGNKDSKRQVQRFVRLSYLSDDFLELIDSRKLTIQIGTEIAFLDKESQQALYAYIENFHHVPNLEQAKKLRDLLRMENNPLSYERIISVLIEAPKPKVINKVTFKANDLRDYFDEDTSIEEMTDVIKMLLTKYKEGELTLNV